MITIYKYKIELKEEFIIEMPIKANIINVFTQNEKPYLWAIIDTRSVKEKRKFLIYGTGHKIKEKEGYYFYSLGSFMLANESLVFHLLEQKEKA